ncbi:MAG: hypothetical protein JHC87_03645, partial [Thermoleophilaceae bacterium]|nr:hypothetical protein [Thermoleophilaceae bacterium]
SGETHTAEGAELRTIKGVVQFFWDAGDEERHLLVNIEPENHHIPDAWELFGDHRDGVIAELDEGVTIEITYFVEHHELVDPDGATTLDAERPRIHSARILGAS